MKNQLIIIGILAILVSVELSGCTAEENNPPTLLITANQTSGFQPLSVTFQIEANDSDGSINSFYIDFGVWNLIG